MPANETISRTRLHSGQIIPRFSAQIHIAIASIWKESPPCSRSASAKGPEGLCRLSKPIDQFQRSKVSLYTGGWPRSRGSDGGGFRIHRSDSFAGPQQH